MYLLFFRHLLVIVLCGTWIRFAPFFMSTDAI